MADVDANAGPLAVARQAGSLVRCAVHGSPPSPRHLRHRQRESILLRLSSGLGIGRRRRLHTDSAERVPRTHQLAPEPGRFGVQAEGEPDQLREENDRDLVARAEVPIGRTLIGVEVELAHRADRRDDVRLELIGGVQQATDQFVRGLRADLRHVAATAVRLQREVDDFRTQRVEQAVEFGRMLVVRPSMLVVGPRHHAPQIGRDAQS